MKEYKLFNTDGKTFFDFRSDPNSRCEGFTISYLDDGTVVMSGDYGTLCWKRNYHHSSGEFYRDYGFPNKESNIGYFEEKVCQFGVTQLIREFDKSYFMERMNESYGKEKEWKDFEEEMDLIDKKNEWEAYEKATAYFQDAWEVQGKKYTEQFEFMFKVLQSVSDQIWANLSKEVLK